MSERTAIEVLAAEAQRLMLSSPVIMVDGSPWAADIWEVVKSVVVTIYDYDIPTDRILTAHPYDPASNPRNYAAWYRLLELLGDTVGGIPDHWENVFIQDSGNSYEYLIGLVQSLTASVLEGLLRLDPVLCRLDIERGEKYEEIEAAARADMAALRGNRLVNVKM